jgi:transposase
MQRHKFLNIMDYKLIIGVDVSKLTLDMTAIKTGDNQFPHDSFLNKKLGFRSFEKWVESFGVCSEEILICMEHTGYYIFSLCTHLHKMGIDYSVVNPMQIKKSMGIQRVKTDKKDSSMIALYASKFTEDLPIGRIPEKELLELKLLVAHRDRLSKQKQGIARVNEELISTLEAKMIRSIVSDNKKLLKLFDDRFKATEQKIKNIIKEIPMLHTNFELMQSIPGIGPQIAINVLLYTHNFNRINTPRKFGSFAGVVPNAKLSGTSIRGKDRVSHIANKKMKSLLHFGALSAIRVDGELKAYYIRKVDEGKSKMSVINAVRNKLVHRIYSVVRRGTPYFNQPILNAKKGLVLS